MDLNAISSQLIANISETEIIEEPFAHKFIENIFPEDFYKNLLTNIPKKNFYTPINAGESVNSKYSDERVFGCSRKCSR